MSHYAVLVITDGEPDYTSIESLLAHYDENLDALTISEKYNEDEYDPKWDWWEIGGRWAGTLLLKDGSYATSAPMAALETTVSDTVREDLEDEWNGLVSEDGTDFFKPEYYLDRYGSADVYVEANSPNVFRAVLTPDGAWHEAGCMGWFGMTSDSPDGWQEYLRDYRKIMADHSGCWATVVDCHI